jgi:hypothetical protein
MIVETVACGHVFCEDCLMSAINAVRNSNATKMNRETHWRFPCPICRTVLCTVSKKSASVPSVTLHSKFVQRLLSDLDVKCTECTWKGKFADCKNHVDTQHPPNSKAKSVSKATKAATVSKTVVSESKEALVESKSAPIEAPPVEEKPLNILYMDLAYDSMKTVRVEFDPSA